MFIVTRLRVQTPKKLCSEALEKGTIWILFCLVALLRKKNGEGLDQGCKFFLEFSRAEKLMVTHTRINQCCQMVADAFPNKA